MVPSMSETGRAAPTPTTRPGSLPTARPAPDTTAAFISWSRSIRARMGAGLSQSQMDAHQQSDLPDRADIRRPGSVQRSGRGHQRKSDSRADAGQLRADRRVSQGEGDDRLHARPAFPVQARPNRRAAADAGQLRRGGQTAGYRERGRLFRQGSRRSRLLRRRRRRAPREEACRPQPPQNLSSEMQIEAIELASNFILKTSLHHPRVLSRAEMPIAVAATGAAWSSDEAVGFVRIVPPREGVKGLDVASAVVATDARDCKGKFASGPHQRTGR